MKEYIVKEGVQRLNGKRVPADRKVMLTDAQAKYEFDQGKIVASDTSAAPAGEEKKKK